MEKKRLYVHRLRKTKEGYKILVCWIDVVPHIVGEKCSWFDVVDKSDDCFYSQKMIRPSVIGTISGYNQVDIILEEKNVSKVAQMFIDNLKKSKLEAEKRLSNINNKIDMLGGLL